MKNCYIACAILVFFALGFGVSGMKGYLYMSAALLFAAALLLIFNLGSESLKRAVALITAIGLIYFCLLEIPIVGNARTDKNPERGYLIVLGAGVRGTEPTLSLIHRLQAAQSYLTTYPDSKAVLSGGKGDGEDISEAQCMFNWLTERGIEPERLFIEDKSSSTMENLEFSKKIIEENGGSAADTAIVSSPYHLYRAKLMAEKLGYESPAGVACVHGYPIYSLSMYIREAFGVTHLIVFGD